MGLLVDGVWHEDWYDTESTGGRFERPDTRFRDWVTPDGRSGYPAEPGRYHLYVSLACPWAHRTLILRHLKGLESVIDVSVVDPFMGEGGWHFSDNPGATPDRVNGCEYLHQVYLKAKPDYTGRVTVPTLWDKVRGTIVNNESAEIIRMLNSAFDDHGRADRDFYPEAVRDDIDRINAFVYDRVNNGVYKAGFATRQGAYEEAVTDLFEALDQLEERLSRQPFLAGDRVTEADWRLFTTLVRFDPVYVSHFKCNVRRLADYPNLWAYTCQLYQVENVAGTVDLDHIKRHYFTSHPMINPTRIIPLGPTVDYNAPHDRGPVTL